jgi:hypothetical protein
MDMKKTKVTSIKTNTAKMAKAPGKAKIVKIARKSSRNMA